MVWGLSMEKQKQIKINDNNKIVTLSTETEQYQAKG